MKNRPKKDIISDILTEYRVMLARAKDAHNSYLQSIKERRTLLSVEKARERLIRQVLFDRECFFYKQRTESLEICRVFKNLLLDYPDKRDAWGSNLYKVRDRRWKREILDTEAASCSE